jgi:two-component system KDP operon response regulator KdpE
MSATAPTADEVAVLVVDDDPALLRVLEAGFDARGYVVETATTGTAALDRASLQQPDIVILDLGLPDIDGVDVCRRLRRWIRTPIIVLSADGSEERKVAALDEGADDYLTKPFSMPELLARVRVALRHRRALSAVVDHAVVEIGGLRLDPGTHVATVEGRQLDLTPKEFALLELLARNVGKVLSHRTVLDLMWSSAQALDTLRGHVSQLRKKLGTGPGVPRIVTESGVGYRLLDPRDQLG